MWWWLGLAIATEIVGTLALRYSDGFSRPLPVAVVVVGYIVSFYAFSQALTRGMGLAVAYAIWSAIGIAVIALVDVLFLDESLTRAQIAGLTLVTAGVIALESGQPSG